MMQILYALESIRTPFLDAIMSTVTHLGEETVFMVVAIFVLWCVDKYWGYYLFSMGFVGTLINQWLKIIFCIPRPWVLDPDFTIVESARAQATGYSFPSGHTQNAVCTFGGIARFTRHKWLRWLCVVLLLVVSFSRMYLGVHTPLDVGVAFGMAAVMIFVFYPLLENSRNHPWILTILFGGMTLLACGFMAYLYMVGAPCAPEDVNYENYVHALENGGKLLGSTLGLMVAYLLDRRFLRYETKAVWWAQLLKLVIGLGLVVAVKSGLKAPLNALVPGVADEIRYFLMVLVAGFAWPATFHWWRKLGNR